MSTLSTVASKALHIIAARVRRWFQDTDDGRCLETATVVSRHRRWSGRSSSNRWGKKKKWGKIEGLRLGSGLGFFFLFFLHRVATDCLPHQVPLTVDG